MKQRTLTLIVTLVMFIGVLPALAFENESLHYVVSYKWGLIHKDAADATLSLRNRGTSYEIVLTARTKPWADRFYEVRDTLLSTVLKDGFRPKSYSKIAHEKGRYSRDDITYRYSGKVIEGSCRRIRVRDGKLTESKNRLTATGPTFDMLSIFYYLRLIDYDRLHTGNVIKTTCFSGSKSETVTIRSLGTETVKSGKRKVKATHIRFRFTSGGGRKSSDDIDAWISDDSRHIPLLLVGKLPIGQVRVRYVP